LTTSVSSSRTQPRGSRAPARSLNHCV
jgi:hypothetical protein